MRNSAFAATRLTLPNAWVAFLPCLLLICCLGCGKQDAELVPVTGTLTIKGQPAGGIMLRFMPDAVESNNGPSSSAITDENGQFTLKCDDGRDGAVPGNHVVTFVDMEEERAAQGEEASKPPRIDSILTTAAGGKRLTIAAGQPVKLEL
jgi:hypothetical protein